VEVYRLEQEEIRNRWGVMVVTKQWWGERHNPLRTHIWATHLLGSKECITAWFEAQAWSIEKSPPVAGRTSRTRAPRLSRRRVCRHDTPLLKRMQSTVQFDPTARVAVATVLGMTAI